MLKEQAKEALAAIGIDLPDFILDALLIQVGSVSDCLASNYDTATVTLIESYLLMVLASFSSDRQVSSESAPSGASRSYKYKNEGALYKSLTNALKALDVNNCTGHLIPPNPAASKHAGVWIGKSSRLL